MPRPTRPDPSVPRWRRAVFPTLLGLFISLYLWRMSGFAAVPPITGHLSNFYLTGAALTLLVGPSAFVDPRRRRRALTWAAALIVVNLVAEIALAVGSLDETVNDAMGGVNTSDPWDGFAGSLAVALVLCLLPPRSPAATGDRNGGRRLEPN